jgi:hypothetical protein
MKLFNDELRPGIYAGYEEPKPKQLRTEDLLKMLGF